MSSCPEQGFRRRFSCQLGCEIGSIRRTGRPTSNDRSRDPTIADAMDDLRDVAEVLIAAPHAVLSRSVARNKAKRRSLHLRPEARTTWPHWRHTRWCFLSPPRVPRRCAGCGQGVGGASTSTSVVSTVVRLAPISSLPPQVRVFDETGQPVVVLDSVDLAVRSTACLCKPTPVSRSILRRGDRDAGARLKCKPHTPAVQHVILFLGDEPEPRRSRDPTERMTSSFLRVHRVSP